MGGYLKQTGNIVAVTGGTGFIGESLCRSLLARGYRVRVLARNPRRAENLRSRGAELVQGSLDDGAALLRLLANSDAVIHCAGTVRGRTLADFTPANVEGIRNLLAALGQHDNHSRLLVLSSLAARQPELSPYAASKQMGEQLILESAAAIDVTVLRPPAVYGPGDKELLPLFRLMAGGLALMPGKPNDRVSLIYIDDLVEAVGAWLSLKKPPQQIFTLSDPATAGYSWAEIVGIASRVLKRKIRLLRTPAPAMNALASLNLTVSGLMGYAPMFTPSKLRELRHPDWSCDCLEFSRATGWHPQIPFEIGLALTLKSPR